ncbi:2-oxo-4-hydroxy-4-carboxy-5-ureidoimidazoline decarboxylase [Cellulosimicrobium arenosum]|uniref:2-oxo-4-hydroxy-4-carboxy-5-ureidoimidazoline decarboxylase n=1 Tax=Cellulosimicrobium arenosum TaxID=2708133 RepID=A0A927J2K6_9MICO|nr:2-oxo-4-hydroxy-4-carboxy-5-ureidoimidazoline decarboxylase [Cellulosimicrobium arenosum]MBD8080470.1 2-oxo-4-hydroxy-4-carboxy-5-ureidoimidazoline decarboxylase [Cellulosimicrobium arenosum]
MRLDQFNALTQHQARDVLLACADVARWADEVAAARPYASVGDAVRSARTVADPWTDSEIDAALARHPRIGERAQGDDADAQMSRTEQAAVATDDDEVGRRLTEGNRAYEEKFGHVFLIRAAGRSAEEILEHLTRRLDNDASTERANAARNLREIAALRLEGVLSA